MKRIFSIFFLLIPLVSVAADEKDTFESRQHFYLYDLEKADGVKAVGELLSYRVYLKYSETANRWVFVITDLSGQFAYDKDFLGSGTILQGGLLGAKEPLKHYRLNEKGMWEPTSDKVQLFVWKSIKPERFEIQTFKYDPGLMAAVTPQSSATKESTKRRPK